MDTIRSTDGTRIAYRRSGAGPALLLVHGAAADHTRWAPVLPALEEHFSVCAMDRRGRGGSGDAEPYAVEREFEDIAALVDAVAEGPGADVLAHSFGALCALEAALLTRNLRRLVLYEPAPAGLQESPETMAEMKRRLEEGDREGLLGTFLMDVAGLTPGELELMRAAPAWQGRVAAAHTILRELERLAATPPLDPKRFGSVETPTLLLLGGESSRAYAENIERIHAMLPHSRIAVLPGQQHVAMNTAPDLFAEEVLSFLLG